MAEEATYDYHGLSIHDAVLHFVSNYFHALRSGADTKVFRIVHGYGSTGHGGIIKKVIRKLLTFEMSHGVLTFTASEEITRHSGYSLVAPIRALHSVPIGLFDPLLLDRVYFLAETINSAIERSERTDKRISPVKKGTHDAISPVEFGTLDPSVLNALNQIHPPEPK